MAWFEGSTEIECDIEEVKRAAADLGELFVGVVALMPGLSDVSVVEQGDDFVTIKTSEGVMKRTNIVRRIETDQVELEYDEEYEAGSLVTATSHFVDTFTAAGEIVIHETVISAVEAPGFLGFFYRHLGSGSIGKALLHAHKSHFEARVA